MVPFSRTLHQDWGPAQRRDFGESSDGSAGIHAGEYVAFLLNNVSHGGR